MDNGTVVYGTGYDYPGYSSPEAYIPPPVTYGYAATYDPYAGSWGSQPAYYNPASWLVPGLVGFAAGAVAGAALWGHGPYWGGGGWWGAGGYNNININNIHNNVWNRHRPPYHGGRPIVHPVTQPGHHPNLYNRPNNLKNQAQRPGQGGRAACKKSAPARSPRPGRDRVERAACKRSAPARSPQTRPGQGERARLSPGPRPNRPNPGASPPEVRTTSWPTVTAMSISGTLRATGSNARGTSGPNREPPAGPRPAPGPEVRQPHGQPRQLAREPQPSPVLMPTG